MSSTDLTGKTVIITGGTSGIGRATALKLAARGAEVIVIGRDAARGAEVEAAVIAASRGHGAFIRADLSLIGDARRVVAELKRRFTAIHALIQSAGVIAFDATTTSEGLDKMFVTNFLHKLVLADGLRDLLARGSGRMVFVAAKIPRILPFGWRTFERARKYRGMIGVARLHLATLLVAQSLAARWRDDGIAVAAIHPGQVDTGIYRSFSRGPWRLARAIMARVITSPERPADLLSWLAFSGEASGITGAFFPSPKDHRRQTPLARAPAAVERVLATANRVLASVAP